MPPAYTSSLERIGQGDRFRNQGAGRHAREERVGVAKQMRLIKIAEAVGQRRPGKIRVWPARLKHGVEPYCPGVEFWRQTHLIRKAPLKLTSGKVQPGRFASVPLSPNPVTGSPSQGERFAALL